MTGKIAITKPWMDLTITDDYMFKAVMKFSSVQEEKWMMSHQIYEPSLII